jgi:hypothetical protein
MILAELGDSYIIFLVLLRGAFNFSKITSQVRNSLSEQEQEVID